jgi:hypothetical protein
MCLLSDFLSTTLVELDNIFILGVESRRFGFVLSRIAARHARAQALITQNSAERKEFFALVILVSMTD